MNLFVIDTPLQLLNAVEARAAFALTDCTFIILQWPFWSRRTFEAILRDNSIRNVEYFSMPQPKRRPQAGATYSRPTNYLREYIQELPQMALRYRFERFLQRYSPAHRLFIGNYRNAYMKHVANVVPYQELIFLDDGTDALAVAEERRAWCPQRSSSGSTFIRRGKDRIRSRYIDWDCTQAAAATFFSSYEIQVTGQDRIVHNDYSQLRTRVVDSDTSDAVYFLGQPLVADGYLTESAYTAYLREIRDHLSGHRLFYVPHPREREVDYLSQTMALGYETLKFDVPIEIALCSAASLPAFLASFFCSALENCSFLFPSQIGILAFEIPHQDLLCCHQLVGNTYTHFRSNRSKTVRLIPLRAITPERDRCHPFVTKEDTGL